MSLFVTAALADPQTLTVTGQLRVFDGDTLELGPVIIRLHGIDAPEAGQSCTAEDGGAWPCGKTASSRLKEMVSGSELSCDPLDRNPWGRLISRCFVDGRDIGRHLVDEGLAWAFTKYSFDYADIEREARGRGLGIWQAPTQTAVDFRADRWARAALAAPGGCPIKGNINAGEKIYHLPWSPYYDRVQMTVDRGEKWFCTEADALEEGWRAARSR